MFSACLIRFRLKDLQQTFPDQRKHFIGREGRAVSAAGHLERYSSTFRAGGTCFEILLGLELTWVQATKILLSDQDDHLCPR